MATLLSSFRTLAGLDDIFAAEKGGLRCVAVRLKSGGLCLFSPVHGLGSDAVKSLADFGDVEFLLAPNHYHNNGLAQYNRAFPDACLCASDAARPRLEKVTGLNFETLAAFQAALPANTTLIEPEGLKTGEVWLRVLGSNCVAWIVVDAFCGPKGKNFTVAGEPAMLGTFPRFGVRDKQGYFEWLEKQIREDKPTMIIPCHGTVVSNLNLARKLEILLGEVF